jgi:hypothetical protein
MMRPYFFFIIFLLTTACQPSYDKEAIVSQLMDEAIQERIQSYKAIRAERCWDGLMREANRLADSILFVEAKLSIDTINRPPIPVKPVAPEKKILKDSTPVKPFLPDTIQ